MSRIARIADVREREAMIWRTQALVAYFILAVVIVAWALNPTEDRIFMMSPQGDLMTIRSGNMELAVRRTAELFTGYMTNLAPENVEANMRQVIDLCEPGYKSVFLRQIERQDLVRKIKQAGQQQTFVKENAVSYKDGDQYEVRIIGQATQAQVGERHSTVPLMAIVYVRLDENLTPMVTGFQMGDPSKMPQRATPQS